jgi:hypothetical protein
MIELASSMPAPQFGEEIFVSARIRAGSRFRTLLCFVLIVVRCFRVPPKMYVYCRLKNIILNSSIPSPDQKGPIFAVQSEARTDPRKMCSTSVDSHV